jgi:mRNA-degrading endonuclease YafQ of YafQ-DinJ toxin-antitoxin module
VKEETDTTEMQRVRDYLTKKKPVKNNNKFNRLTGRKRTYKNSHISSALTWQGDSTASILHFLSLDHLP